MKKLNWHSDRGEAWKAWAPELYPDDTMVPLYRITKIQRNQAIRKITLRQSGRPDVEVGLASNLAEAKKQAQEDYEKRQQ